jgi:hypothetical protein
MPIGFVFAAGFLVVAAISGRRSYKLANSNNDMYGQEAFMLLKIFFASLFVGLLVGVLTICNILS